MGSWFNLIFLIDWYLVIVIFESINKCVDRKLISYFVDECVILKKKLLSVNKILREKLVDMSILYEDNGVYFRVSNYIVVS